MAISMDFHVTKILPKNLRMGINSYGVGIKRGTMSLIVCEAFNLANILGYVGAMSICSPWPCQIQPPELKALGFIGSIAISDGF